MSWQSLAEAFEYVQRTPALTTNEVVVLLAIANFSNAEGRNAFPSRRRLRAVTKLSENALRVTIRKLEGRGVISSRLQRGKKGYTEYILHLPRVKIKALPQSPFPFGKPLPERDGNPSQEWLSSDPVQRSKIPLPSSFPLSSAQESAEKDMEKWLRCLGAEPGSHLWMKLRGEEVG